MTPDCCGQLLTVLLPRLALSSLDLRDDILAVVTSTEYTGQVPQLHKTIKTDYRPWTPEYPQATVYMVEMGEEEGGGGDTLYDTIRVLASGGEGGLARPQIAMAGGWQPVPDRGTSDGRW